MNLGKITFLAVGLAIIAVMATALFDLSPNNSDDATDVIILMGQSNADYREQTAVPSDAAPIPEPGTAWYYGTEAMPADFMTDPAECKAWPMSDASGARIGDKWPAMAAAYTEATGHNVAMLALAKVGVSITTFEPGTGYAYEKSTVMAKAAIKAFEDAGMNIGRISVVWIQGESDQDMNAEEYKGRMLDLFNAVLNHGLGVDVSNPIWINKVRESKAPAIAAAQIEFCREHPGIAQIASEVADGFTEANGLMADYAHYTQEGNNIIGEAVGNAIGDAANDASAKQDTMWLLIGMGIIVCIAAALVAILRN